MGLRHIVVVNEGVRTEVTDKKEDEVIVVYPGMFSIERRKFRVPIERFIELGDAWK